MIVNYRSHSIRLLRSVIYDGRVRPVSLSPDPNTSHRTDATGYIVFVSSPTPVRIVSSSVDFYHTFHSPCSSPSGALHSTVCQSVVDIPDMNMDALVSLASLLHSFSCIAYNVRKCNAHSDNISRMYTIHCYAYVKAHPLQSA